MYPVLLSADPRLADTRGCVGATLEDLHITAAPGRACCIRGVGSSSLPQRACGILDYRDSQAARARRHVRAAAVRPLHVSDSELSMLTLVGGSARPDAAARRADGGMLQSGYA